MLPHVIIYTFSYILLWSFSLQFLKRLSLLLCCGFGLGRLLPVAADHDHTEEGTDNGRAEQDEDDGDADGPDPRREEVLEGVVGIDERLCKLSVAVPRAQRWSNTYHQQRPDRVVEKHDGGGHEHGEANESVQLGPVSSHSNANDRLVGSLTIVEGGCVVRDVEGGTAIAGEGGRRCRWWWKVWRRGGLTRLEWEMWWWSSGGSGVLVSPFR